MARIVGFFFFFFLLSTLPMMIQTSGESARLTQKELVLLKKVPADKFKSFLKSNFDQHQICKIVLTQSTKFGTLVQLICFIFLLKIKEII